METSRLSQANQVLHLKVAFLTGSLTRTAGGLFESVKGLARGLASTPDSEVRIFGPSDQWVVNDIGSWAGLNVTSLRRFGSPHFGFAPEMGGALGAYAPAVTHVHGIWMYHSWANLRHSKRCQTPYVVSPRGMLQPWALAGSTAKKAIAKWLFESEHLKRAACIHALSMSELDSIRAFGLTNPVCVIPNGMELPNPIEAVTPPAWSNRFPAGTKIMLYLGRLHRNKGVEELLRAWAAACPMGWGLVVAGWGKPEYVSHVERLAEQLAVGKNIQMVGPIYGQEKDATLRYAHAFALPSYSEGLPMAVLEAWSYGLPALITSACNLDVGVKAGAAICVTNEVDAVTVGIKDLCGVPDAVRASMGERGRRLVATQFNWTALGAQLRSIYCWILDGGEAPPTVAH